MTDAFISASSTYQGHTASATDVSPGVHPAASSVPAGLSSWASPDPPVVAPGTIMPSTRRGLGTEEEQGRLLEAASSREDEDESQATGTTGTNTQKSPQVRHLTLWVLGIKTKLFVCTIQHSTNYASAGIFCSCIPSLTHGIVTMLVVYS